VRNSRRGAWAFDVRELPNNSYPKDMDSGYTVIGHPRHRKRRDGPLKLRSEDKTDQTDAQWTAEEIDGVLELTLQLRGKPSPVSINTSILDRSA
jgi:hypothetical protein